MQSSTADGIHRRDDTWGTSCGDLSLILDYDGTPKAPNGTYYQSHLAAVAH